MECFKPLRSKTVLREIYKLQHTSRSLILEGKFGSKSSLVYFTYIYTCDTEKTTPSEYHLAQGMASSDAMSSVRLMKALGTRVSRGFLQLKPSIYTPRINWKQRSKDIQSAPW